MSIQHKETIYNLLLKSGIKKSIVNMLSIYRIAICPAIIILFVYDISIIKWLILSAFITDMLDGFLARKWNAVTKLGSKLDSIADDCLFITAFGIVIYANIDFFIHYRFPIFILMLLFISKLFILLVRHKKIISCLHTYLSKAAALFQALFILNSLFLGPGKILFGIALFVTIFAIVEEIVIIYSMNKLRQDIKGLFFTKSKM